MSPLAKSAAFAAKLGISAGFLWLALRPIEIEFVLGRVLQASVPLVAAALAISFLHSVFLIALRWRIAAGIVGFDLSPGVMSRMVGIALFFNQVLPSSVGGDAVRVVMLGRLRGSLSEAARTVLLDRLSGVATLAVLALVGQLWVFPAFAGSPLRFGPGLVIAAAFAALALLWIIDRLPLPMRDRRLGKVYKIGADWRLMVREPQYFLPMALTSLAVQVLIAMEIWCLALAVGVDLPVAPTLAVVPTVMLLLLIPISIAGWGVREQAMVIGLGLMGVDPAASLTISLLFGLVTLANGLMCLPAWLMSPSAAE